MRKLAAALAMLVSLVSFTPAALAETPIRIVVGITQLDLDTAPVEEQSGMLVPLRPVAEALGFTIVYDAADRHVTLTKGAKVVEVWVGLTKAKVNGKDVALKSAPKMAGDRLMAPVSFISGQLDGVVTWIEKERMLHVVRGEEYARGLYETAQDVAKAEKYADQKSHGDVKITMKMSGQGLPPGGMTVEMPMTVDIHVSNGEMLMSTKASMTGLPGAGTTATQMALKDGKLYTQIPGTEKWIVVGEGTLEEALQTNSATSLVDTAQLEQALKKDVAFTLVGFEESNGAKVARIDMKMPPTALDGLAKQILGSMTGAPAGIDMKMSLDRLTVSSWIDTATGQTNRFTMDMKMVATASQNGATAQVELTLVADLTNQFVSEPIQFPDLSGAIDMNADELD